MHELLMSKGGRSAGLYDMGDQGGGGVPCSTGRGVAPSGSMYGCGSVVLAMQNCRAIDSHYRDYFHACAQYA